MTCVGREGGRDGEGGRGGVREPEMRKARGGWGRMGWLCNLEVGGVKRIGVLGEVLAAVLRCQTTDGEVGDELQQFDVV